MGYGISVVIYDKAGDYYFFIVKRKDGAWEIPKRRFEEKPGDEVGQLTSLLDTYLQQYKIAPRFEQDTSYGRATVFVGDSMTNVPVHLPDSHENYLWAKAGTVADRLEDEDDKKIFKRVNEILSANS